MASPVEDIKSRLNAAEVIGRDVRLQRSGRYLKGLCPFHQEKTPSFFVFGDRGTFRCFGCGEGGDLFTYVMRRDGSSFPDALRLLAGEAGVELRAQDRDPEADRQRRSTRAALEEAANLMHRLLREAREAAAVRDYPGRARGIGGDARRVPPGICAVAWIAGYHAPAQAGHRRGGAERHGTGPGRRRTAARLFLQPPDLPHQRAARGGDRVWRAGPGRRDAQCT